MAPAEGHDQAAGGPTGSTGTPPSTAVWATTAAGAPPSAALVSSFAAANASGVTSGRSTTRSGADVFAAAGAAPAGGEGGRTPADQCGSHGTRAASGTKSEPNSVSSMSRTRRTG